MVVPPISAMELKEDLMMPERERMEYAHMLIQIRITLVL